MTSNRKKPGSAFWATVAMLIALVGYPLSFGPACWIGSRIPHYEVPEFLGLYLPLSKVVAHCPDWIYYGMLWYGEFLSDEDFIPYTTLRQASEYH